MEEYKNGIKAFNRDGTCLGFKFEEGEVYEISGELELCKNGFHFCPYIACTLEYYPDFNNSIYAEVEALDKVLYEEPTKLKAVTNKIRIVRFLSENEVRKIFEKRNNTGDWNTGVWNTGNSNTGNWNTGNRNTGYSNTGDCNTGDCNTGNWNTGNSNTGNRNTGNRNTGVWNTGYCNTGDRNTGDRNTGDWNTGDWNTGDRNTGYSNTGYSNTGNRNTGDRNTGDWNTGDWNTGNRNTGYFNTKEPAEIRIFNSLVDRILWEICDKPNFIYFNINTELGYKGSFQKSYNQTTMKDKLKIFNIPNFDKEIFFEISGIDVTELEKYLK